MKRIFLVFQLQFICFLGNTQNKLNSTLITKLELISFYENRRPDTLMSYRTPFGCVHSGTVLDGIMLLVNAKYSSIKVKGKVPDAYISFKIFSGRRSEDLERRLLEDLKEDYRSKFKISEIMDTCEVWQLEVEDSSKLNVYSFDRDSRLGNWFVDQAERVAGKPFNPKDWRFVGVTMTYLADYFEKMTKEIILTDSKDDVRFPNRYNFYFNTDTARDISSINIFFKEKYGVVLKKSTGIIEKVLIEFLEDKN
jgi:hypothetical protein